ncbi:hypothetical protein NGB25_12930 [Staphylococcus saprophyticus]|uniref:hypothetical protein n=1 Tax=Staphylococcus saprophyticus TaxID=29385 RepID=UPI002DB79A32|nr:hypothetical protein [Staphylococcus saprophyticus]MEB7678005.1 hypothetical protein [Staphylococcus saprophyticus]
MKKTVVEMDKIFISEDFNISSEHKENLKYYTKQLKSWSKIINLMIFAMLLTNLIQWFDKAEYVRLTIGLIVLVITISLIIGKQKNKKQIKTILYDYDPDKYKEVKLYTHKVLDRIDTVLIGFLIFWSLLIIITNIFLRS